jgi:hypothetical protein
MRVLDPFAGSGGLLRGDVVLGSPPYLHHIDKALEGDRRRRPFALSRGATIATMCRNIRTLHNFEPPASEEEIRAAALQYVRKISGFTRPSQANVAAFERAVESVTAASAELLGSLVTSAAPKDREVEAAKARARAAQRFAA